MDLAKALADLVDCIVDARTAEDGENPNWFLLDKRQKAETDFAAALDEAIDARRHCTSSSQTAQSIAKA